MICGPEVLVDVEEMVPRSTKEALCLLELGVEKSSCVQRLGVESSTFLHDRQTCVIVMRGLFMGNVLHSSSQFMKKRGISMKTSLGSWFMGCIIDSRERSFGTTSFSNALLTPVTCERAYESGDVARMSVQNIFYIPRQPWDQRSHFP